MPWTLGAGSRHYAGVTDRRIISITALVALGPALTWWVLVVIFSQPDEGANIGAGIVGLGVLMLSWVSALVFAVVALLRRKRRQSSSSGRS